MTHDATMVLRYTLSQITQLLQASTVQGQFDGELTGIAALSEAKAGELSFLGNLKYKAQVPSSQASVILVPIHYEGAPAENQAYIRIENPSMALATLCQHIERTLFPPHTPGIHPSAVVDASAKIHPLAHIGPLCVIERGAVIGEGTVLKAQVHVGAHVTIGQHCYCMPHVSLLDYTQIGDHVRLHSGVVVGSDGYGYECIQGVHQKVPQIGSVRIESSVEIGANTTIDRARFGTTVIGEGTKIDNLVQVAHNVVVGKHCLIVSQVGISGSTVLEDYVVAGGQVGFAGHLHIGKGCQIGAQSGVHTDLPAGSKVLGSPTQPFMLGLKIAAAQKELPSLIKRVTALEDKLQ